MIIIVFFQEGPSGIFTINSPVAGEVVECNEILKKQPKVLADSPEDLERSWIIELDAACEMEDDEVEWKALDKFEAKEAEEVKEVEVKASA